MRAWCAPRLVSAFVVAGAAVSAPSAGGVASAGSRTAPDRIRE
ncbi:MAG: hypothetical protein ACRDR6_25650 [Pseudonocardiaceae bacterium]